MNLSAANRRSDPGQDGSGCGGIRLAQVWLSGLFGFFLGAWLFPDENDAGNEGIISAE